jgi:ankyrin repeat protein
MVEFIRDKLINKNPPLRITGRTPLHVAAQRGCLDVIECIFECLWKEHRNPTDENGITPLHLAATFGQLEALKMFLKENVGKNPASFVDKKTPFHLAAEYGMFNIIEYLADILPPNQLNDKSNSGESASDYARKNSHDKIVSFLKAII